MNNTLQHHGIKGQKWGIRRYQNPDGTLTAAGRRRYQKPDGTLTAAGRRRQKKFEENVNRNWVDTYNRASNEFNKYLSSLYEGKYKNDTFDERYTTKRGQQFVKEVSAAWNKTYKEFALSDFGRDYIASGEEWVNYLPFYNQYEEFIIRK